MFRKLTGMLLLSVLIGGQLLGHSGKPKYHVIIDTDGALDDMRALTMLLSANDIRVLAITSSQGTLMPEEVYGKVISLLSTFHHEGIEVGIGEETHQTLPAWSSFARGISWSEEAGKDFHFSKTGATQLLGKTAKGYPEKLTLIALGSLKTYADWIRSSPEVAGQIDRIIWYNEMPVADGFNYQASPESYRYIRQTGIRLDLVGNDSGKYRIDEAYLDTLRHLNSAYASQIVKVHSRPAIVEMIHQEHLRLWDDLVPLYLLFPVLFDTDTVDDVSYSAPDDRIPVSFIDEIIAKLLISASAANNRVFIQFPVDSSLYKPAYANIINPTIRKFGLIEWKAICMTNEIHGHTGIYSIIGAKMGIRAMEFFNVGVNNMTATSYAGDMPPLSCFNDGVQISTGSTIGQGLITISDTVLDIPATMFEFNHRKVIFSVKPGIAEQMKKEIRYGVQTYGLQTEQYWLYIEQLAIRYWNEYDRFAIFEMEIVNGRAL